MIRFPGIALLLCWIFFSCDYQRSRGSFLLDKISANESGIEFKNSLGEDESMNIVEYLYFYNGGGVSAGDFNLDGLEDLVFVSNQNGASIYINQGQFQFKDITSSSGITPSGNWHTGSTIADINQDGYPDLFICGVGGYKNLNGSNRVFINNGNLTFTDKTDSLGLTFQGLSTQSIFFDHDQDGDLDLYLLNHSVHSVRSVGSRDLRDESDLKAGDILYENRLIPDGKLFFVPTTSKASIYNSALGYGLGAGAGDLNMDGKTDLYISNDFFENDYLYINQGGGKFRELSEKSLAHTSRFSMGNVIADLNNDLMPDIMTLDMLPWKEQVIKTSAGEDPFDIFEYKKRLGFHYQYARNTVQINLGNDENGIPKFSDIAPFAGIDATDWSWSPLAADWDNDGWKDVFISNGIMRRPNDMDYISFISSDSSKKELPFQAYLDQMPSGAVPNAIFRNKDGVQFENMSGKWLDSIAGLSNGAVYTDLDNDGDLDLAVNNLNDYAGIYRNNQNQLKGISIELEGEKPNRDAIGSKVFLFVQGKPQYQELQPSRGFESSVSKRLHFGLGTATKPDSIIVVWPDGTGQKLTLTVALNGQPVKIKKSSTSQVPIPVVNKKNYDSFELVTEGAAHKENQYTAFQTERLIPHSLDATGPSLAIGDIDGDGKTDLYQSGTSAGPGFWNKQFNKGKFSSLSEKKTDPFQADESAVQLFDANGDGSLDMLILYGGQQPLIPTSYFPQLWLNNGKGNFTYAANNLPTIALNGSVANTVDIDKDGDQDIFLGGNLAPANYGLLPYSYLLINDGSGRFLNQTTSWFPGTEGRLGMVSDAVWSDLNNDEYPDLILAGEWMTLQVWINQRGMGFENKTEEWGLGRTSGLWHSLSAGDFDNDGDIDLMAGNHGLNSRLRASVEQPIKLYITDLDNNGSIDQLLEYNNNGKRWPFWSKDQLIKQAPPLKKYLLKYSSYQEVVVPDLLRLAGKTESEFRTAETLASTYFENTGGKFILHTLPAEAQFSPVFAICPIDLNSDRLTDFLIGGNLFSVTPELGRMNGSKGLVLYGKGNGTFEPINGVKSGMMLEGECRDIQVISENQQEVYIAAGMNNAPLRIYRYRKNQMTDSPSPKKPN